MNTTIKTVLENGKDFFKEIEELIYKVSWLEAELKHEKRINYLQSEDVIRCGTELQNSIKYSAQLSKINAGLVRSFDKFKKKIKALEEEVRDLKEENEAGKAPVESDQLKMAKRLFSVDYNIEEYSMLSYSSRLHYMKMAEEALKGF